MGEEFVKEIIRFLKQTFGMKFVVKDIKSNSLSLVILKRGNVDGDRDHLVRSGISNIEYDSDQLVRSFIYNDVRVLMLTQKECG